MRFFHLGYQSFWFDEVFSFNMARRSLCSLVGEALRDAVHPPLFYLLLKPFVTVSDAEWVARLPSALLGVIFVCLLYVAGSDMVNWRVGGVAALIALLSPFHVYYSQETRMYALLMATSLLATWLLYRAASADQPIYWLGYVMALFLGMMTHYMTLGLVAGHAGWIISEHRRNGVASPPLRRWLAAIGGAFALCLPWIVGIALFGQSLQARAEGGSLPTALYSLIGAFMDFNVGYFQGLFREAEAALVLTLSALLFAFFFWWRGVVYLKKECSSSGVFLLVIFSLIGSSLFSFLSAIFSEFHLPRYYAAAYPWAVMLLSAGVIATWEQRRPFAVGGGIIMFVVWCIALKNYYFNPLYAREDWRSVAGFMHAQKRPDDLLVFNAPYEDIPFRHYFKDSFRSAGLPSINRPSAALVDQEARQIIQNNPHGRIWLILCYDHITDPENLVRSWFDTHLTLVARHSFPQIELLLYRPSKGASP